jgi:hypothetical protein
VTTTVKVAHVRLCHSRMPFVRAYPRETQEMVFDAHDKAFAFFGGACARGIYDNMKTAVDAIFVGKDRAYNRRFQQMCGHYLVEPVACTPGVGLGEGAGREPGRRDPAAVLRAASEVQSYAELNAWLLDRCVAWAKANPHPEMRDKTIWEVFEEERPSLVPYVGPSTASMPCRPRSPRPASFGSTRTATRSMPAPWAGRSRSGPMPSGIEMLAGRPDRRQPRPRLRARQGDLRSRCITSPCWPASPVPCATARRSRTGTCRRAMRRVQRKLERQPNGDRQMVDILAAVLTDGLDAVDAACAEALHDNVHSAGVVLNILARHREPAPPLTIATPDALRLSCEPVADCRPL